MKSALNPKQVRHQNRRARQKAKKQFFNSGENTMETMTTNDQLDGFADITITASAEPVGGEEKLTQEQQQCLDKINELTAQLPEDVQAKMKSNELDFDSLSEIDQLRVRQIFEIVCEPVAKQIFGKHLGEKSDALPGLINEFVNISILTLRKQMSDEDRKKAVIQHLDFIFAQLPPVSPEMAQQGIDQITSSMGIKINASELKSLQSPAISNAEVREETKWITGSNMFIGGAVVGTIFNMLTQGLTMTNGLVGVATAGAGWLAKDKINEMVEDSTIKLAAAGVVGAGVTIGGTMALDAIRAKLRDGSGVSQEA